MNKIKKSTKYVITGIIFNVLTIGFGFMREYRIIGFRYDVLLFYLFAVLTLVFYALWIIYDRKKK